MKDPYRWLVVLAVPVLFLWLGANSIWDANEAFYVDTPRQMVLSGDYLNPAFNGQPRFNKPVLSYWIVAGLYRTFGISVGVERLGIATGAAGILLAAFLIGRAIGSARTGALAALILVTAPRFVMYSRRIFIDVWVTCFMSLALAGFVLAQRHPQHRRRYLVLMYIAIGLGVLTKGPVALILPAAVGLAWLAIERRLGDLRRLMLLPGILIILGIVLPWYIADYGQHGWTNIRRFFIDENVGRYTTSMVPGDRNIFFYIAVLFGDLFPWAPLVVFPLVAIATQWRRRSVETDGAAALRRLLWLWTLIIVAVYSFSRTKQDLYIFPVAPAVAVLVADALLDARTRAMRVLVAMVCVLCVLLAAMIGWAFGPGAGFYAVPGATLYAVLLGVTGLTALAAVIRRGVGMAVPLLAAGFVVLNYVFVGRVLTGLEAHKPVPALTRTWQTRASPDADLVYYNMVLPSFVYYADRAIPEMPSPEDAASRLSRARETWMITGENEWADLQRRVPGICIADRRPLLVFDAKLSSVIDRTPPPDVLLITNKCRF